MAVAFIQHRSFSHSLHVRAGRCHLKHLRYIESILRATNDVIRVTHSINLVHSFVSVEMARQPKEVVALSPGQYINLSLLSFGYGHV